MTPSIPNSDEVSIDQLANPTAAPTFDPGIEQPPAPEAQPTPPPTPPAPTEEPPASKQVPPNPIPESQQVVDQEQPPAEGAPPEGGEQPPADANAGTPQEQQPEPSPFRFEETPSEPEGGAPANNTIDESEVIRKATDGRYSNPQALRDLVTEVEGLRKQVNTPVEKSEMVTKLEEHMESGGDPQTFFMIQKLDTDNMSDFDALLTREQLDNPGIPRDKLEKLLKVKYPEVSSQQLEDMDEDQKAGYEADKVVMEVEAAKARNYLLSKKSDLPDYKQREIDAQKVESERQLNWLGNEHAPGKVVEVVNSFKDLKLEVKVGGKMQSASFDISDADRSTLLAVMKDAIVKYNIPYTEEGYRQAQTFADNSLFLSKKADLLGAAFEAGLQKGNKEQGAMATNPSALNQERRPEGAAPVDPDTELANKVDSFLSK